MLAISSVFLKFSDSDGAARVEWETLLTRLMALSRINLHARHIHQEEKKKSGLNANVLVAIFLVIEEPAIKHVGNAEI